MVRFPGSTESHHASSSRWFEIVKVSHGVDVLFKDSSQPVR